MAYSFLLFDILVVMNCVIRTIYNHETGRTIINIVNISIVNAKNIFSDHFAIQHIVK